uniref:Uncharacterized protein n=2 Tax=viral metagenome TaxID=1070528 RepID=A0A6M3XVJ2_9ZZZZ
MPEGLRPDEGPPESPQGLPEFQIRDLPDWFQAWIVDVTRICAILGIHELTTAMPGPKQLQEFQQATDRLMRTLGIKIENTPIVPAKGLPNIIPGKWKAN